MTGSNRVIDVYNYIKWTSETIVVNEIEVYSLIDQ